jgi:hypothetical protein
MKKTIAALVILAALFVAWSVWPFMAMYDFVRAAQAGDAAKIEKQVDFPALRRSISAQVFEAYARLSGIKTDGGGLMTSVASALADPFIEKLISPATLAELLKNGWPKAIGGDAAGGTAKGLDLNTLGNAWQLYANSDYGLGEFRVSVPANLPKAQQFRIELSLTDWAWKLSGLGLPADLQERLAREMMKQQGKPG